MLGRFGPHCFRAPNVISFHGPHHAKGRVAPNRLLITPPHSIAHTFHPGCCCAHIFSIYGGAPVLVFFWEGKRSVWIGLTFCIMSFCHECVFSFVLKWAHRPHSVKSFRTSLDLGVTNIFPSVTVRCGELVLTFLSAISPEPQQEGPPLSRMPLHHPGNLGAVAATLVVRSSVLFETVQGREELVFAFTLPNCNIFPLLPMGPTLTCP